MKFYKVMENSIFIKPRVWEIEIWEVEACEGFGEGGAAAWMHKDGEC